MRFRRIKELAFRRAKQIAAARHIQRLYRGYKGREARDIEKELQLMDHRARPLLAALREAEERAKALEAVVSRLEWEERHVRESLDEIQLELQFCLNTNNKYTDSSRINNIPQRFLTKFLRVRLKDHLEHEQVLDISPYHFQKCVIFIQQEVQRVKFMELNTRRGDFRDAERDVLALRRELVPLTTGLISDVKRKRAFQMRQAVRLKKTSVLKIQVSLLLTINIPQFLR